MDELIDGITRFGMACLVVIIGGALAIGWVLNIAQLIIGTETIGMLLARVAGIFMAPLGGILGWF
jgi:hypothetical protein